jgi:siroheme synthase-like protein
MTVFPAVLNVKRRSCLVVGDDQEAIEKARRLKRAGARLRVVAPDKFRLSMLKGRFFVVFCPKDRPVLVKKVFRYCRKHRILLCAIDQSEYCDVANVAVYERGDLKIMISTGGVSPSLAKKMAQGLHVSLDHIDLEKKMAGLKTLRRSLFKKKMDPALRRKCLIDAVNSVRFSARLAWPEAKKWG